MTDIGRSKIKQVRVFPDPLPCLFWLEQFQRIKSESDLPLQTHGITEKYIHKHMSIQEGMLITNKGNGEDQTKTGGQEFDYFLCPEPGCRQVIQEAHKSYFSNPLDRVKCPECGGKGVSVCSYDAVKKAGKRYVHFICESCRIGFNRFVPPVRLKCNGCKQIFEVCWDIFVLMTP